MAIVKLFTIHAYKHNQKNVIPYAGEVHISNEGSIELEQEIADKVVDADIGFQYEDPKEVTTTTTETTTEEVTTTTTAAPATTTTTTAEPTTTTTIAETVNTTTLSAEDKQSFNTLLESPEITLAQLQELAAAFPRAEWISLDQAALTAYLKQKIS